MDTPYANRELDEKFDEIKLSLGRIETQTMKTNGRVSWLEKMMFLSMGAVSVLTATQLSEFLGGIFK